MLDLIAGDRSGNRLPMTGGGPARPAGDDDTVGSAAVADPAENRSAAAGGNHDERSADSPAIGAANKDASAAAVDAAGVPVKHPETDTATTTVVDIEPTDAAAAGIASAVSGQLADRGASRIAPRPATGRGGAGARQATDTGTAETGAEKIMTAGERVGVFQASAHSPRLSKNRSAGSPIPPGSIAATLRLSSRSAVTAEQE